MVSLLLGFWFCLDKHLSISTLFDYKSFTDLISVCTRKTITTKQIMQICTKFLLSFFMCRKWREARSKSDTMESNSRRRTAVLHKLCAKPLSHLVSDPHCKPSYSFCTTAPVKLLSSHHRRTNTLPNSGTGQHRTCRATFLRREDDHNPDSFVDSATSLHL
ncbi:hypothetical protein RYX36_027539 [Vicia faba]